MEHKTQCRCFFDARGIAQKAHSWIDEALWVLWRSKVPCHRGIERVIDPYKGIAYFNNYIYTNLLLSFHTLDTFLKCVFFGVSLTNFNKSTTFTEERRQSQGRRNQKNSCTREQIALTNLKRSGFVFLRIVQIIEGWNTKRSAAVFLMRVG